MKRMIGLLVMVVGVVGFNGCGGDSDSPSGPEVQKLEVWKKTFGEEYGHDGQVLDKAFEFPTIGVSMMDAVNLLKVPKPDYIKMDVDGIEHLILKGGAPVLREIKGALIEINEEFEKQYIDSTRYLSEAGLILKEKRQSDMFKNGPYKSIFNQIWHRPLS